ncbi:MAG: hypothetical protein OXF41_02530 [bacterium]|nr:hypothetical protein [bacterium]
MAAAVGQRCDSSDGDGWVHEPAIDLLAAEGILDRTGCTGGLSCPGDPIHRWVVALWLVRAPGHQPLAEGAPNLPEGKFMAVGIGVRTPAASGPTGP